MHVSGDDSTVNGCFSLNSSIIKCVAYGVVPCPDTASFGSHAFVLA